MFDVTLTVKMGSAKTPVVFEWEDLSKLQIVADLEDTLLKTLMKLNGIGKAVAEGVIPKSATTNPVEMTVEFLVKENGVKWHRTVLEYPKMGEEQQAMFLGVLAGGLSGVAKRTRVKAKAQQVKVPK